MIYNYKDAKVEMNEDLSLLPFISIPKEQLKQLSAMFEPEQVGKVVIALSDSIYGEQINYNGLSKAEYAMLDSLLSGIARNGVKYFNKVKNLPNVKLNEK